MFKPIIRLLSFFAKEINEVRRQPRLVLSLLLGPFLILLLFGVGYQGNRPVLRTALVLPPEGATDIDQGMLEQASSLNFEVVSVDRDLEGAMARLQRGELDVVEIIPPDIEERVLSGEQSSVTFRYNETNPLNEQWIQYLAYAQVVEINRAILLETAGSMQGEARATHDQLVEVRQQLDAAEAGLAVADRERLQESIGRLRAASGALAVSALLARPGSGSVDGAQAREELLQLQQDLDLLDQALSSGDLQQQRERIAATRERVVRLEEVTDMLASLPPAVIVSPLQQTYENLSGASYDLMTFYAPSVLALIVQHIAVTLGALSLVREQLLGATEFFRVAPVSIFQVLLGKYFGYTLFIAFIIVVLIGLMFALGVPFLGDPLIFVGIAALLTLAALGIGFFISAVSTSDSQAVQLSMLVLLLSIFFSGFFLPLENFWEPLRAVGYTLPLTHGITGFHAVMLRGQPPSTLAWTALGAIAALTFVASLIAARVQFRRT